MPKQEAELKAKFMNRVRELEPNWRCFRHEDILTGGIPDVSTTGNKRTCWLEFKHATPNFTTNGLQEITCRDLSIVGFCYHVIFHEGRTKPSNMEFKQTVIISPSHVRGKKGNMKDILNGSACFSCSGFDNDFIINFLRKFVHGT
jgi:hypothetical protein